MWPIVTLGCLSLGRGRLRVLAGVAIVGTVVSTVLMAVLYQADDPSRAYYGTDTHAHPILIGVLLALVLVDRAAASARGQRIIDAAGLVALAGVLAAFAFAHDTSPFLYRGGSFVFAVLVAVVITAVMRAPRGLLGRIFAVRTMVAIGVISYGIYLWHWPVIRELERWAGPGQVLHQPAVRLVVAVVGTVALAACTYAIVERPLMRWARSVARRGAHA